MESNHKTSLIGRWTRRILMGLGLITLISMLFGLFMGDGLPQKGNTAILRLHGAILADGEDESDLFSLPQKNTLSTRTVRLLKEIKETSTIKALVLEMNSPGGTPVASAEIAKALEDFPIPTLVWIREMGTSGAYWVAAASEHIVAHPMSITGSVGVLANQFGFEDLLERFDIRYRRQVSGSLKDIGDPFRPPKETEKLYFQSVLEEIHNHFLEYVQNRRQLTPEALDQVKTGVFFTGKRALELGLVDTLGGREEVEAWLKEKIKEPVTFQEFGKKHSLLGNLRITFSSLFKSLGRQLGLGLWQGIHFSMQKPPAIQVQGP